MKKIGKNDTVVLPDGCLGRALDVYSTAEGRMYKIQRMDNREIQYFDESKVVMKKRNLWNSLLTLFS